MDQTSKDRAILTEQYVGSAFQELGCSVVTINALDGFDYLSISSPDKAIGQLLNETHNRFPDLRNGLTDLFFTGVPESMKVLDPKVIASKEYQGKQLIISFDGSNGKLSGYLSVDVHETYPEITRNRGHQVMVATGSRIIGQIANQLGVNFKSADILNVVVDANQMGKGIATNLHRVFAQIHNVDMFWGVTRKAPTIAAALHSIDKPNLLTWGGLVSVDNNRVVIEDPEVLENLNLLAKFTWLNRLTKLLPVHDRSTNSFTFLENQSEKDIYDRGSFLIGESPLVDPHDSQAIPSKGPFVRSVTAIEKAISETDKGMVSPFLTISQDLYDTLSPLLSRVSVIENSTTKSLEVSIEDES